jgi:hypothetical protein
METVTDQTERQTILNLLAEEEQKLQDDGDNGPNPGRNVGQQSHHDYQQYAEECLRWADEADSEQHRELFLGMARAWTQADLISKGVMVPKAENDSASLPSLEDRF